jgi:hypothetical protein
MNLQNARWILYHMARSASSYENERESACVRVCVCVCVCGGGEITRRTKVCCLLSFVKFFLQIFLILLKFCVHSLLANVCQYLESCVYIRQCK